MFGVGKSVATSSRTVNGMRKQGWGWLGWEGWRRLFVVCTHQRCNPCGYHSMCHVNPIHESHIGWRRAGEVGRVGGGGGEDKMVVRVLELIYLCNLSMKSKLEKSKLDIHQKKLFITFSFCTCTQVASVHQCTVSIYNIKRSKSKITTLHIPTPHAYPKRIVSSIP
jgi:hypothetical protein